MDATELPFICHIALRYVNPTSELKAHKEK